MVSLGECSIYTRGKKINIFCCCVGGSINVCESNWFILLFKSSTSLLIFCLVVLSIIETGGLKSAISIGELAISHFECANVCFIYFCRCEFFTYTFLLAVPSSKLALRASHMSLAGPCNHLTSSLFV